MTRRAARVMDACCDLARAWLGITRQGGEWFLTMLTGLE
jgi:sorbitol-specific phosphotransferase system component IIC